MACVSSLSSAFFQRQFLLDSSSFTSAAVGRSRGLICLAAKKNVVEILEERGLLQALTGEKLRQVCENAESPLKVYCGFDPTAESLHLGNLLGIIVLSWFQRCGHIPVAVIGGATARVGDPSGKSIERPALDEATLEKNSDGVKRILIQLLKSPNSEDRHHPPLILNNLDWWKEIRVLDFLRDVGKNARVGSMIAKESVKRRMESEDGISFTEFTYQLLQGYDFVHLCKEEGVCVEIGGSDQWGNITAGIDLIRRILQRDDVWGMTFPLLVKSDGSKFGKSEDGAVWLSSNLLSPYQFYQHLFATPDSDVIKLLKMLTFMSIDEIEEIEECMKKRRNEYVANSAQRKLAEQVTRFVHGDDGVEDALKITQALAPGNKERIIDWEAIQVMAEDSPACVVGENCVVGSVVDLCVVSGLVASKSVARRLIKQGGLYLNNSKVVDDKQVVMPSDIIQGKMLLLSAGKKNKMVIRIQ